MVVMTGTVWYHRCLPVHRDTFGLERSRKSGGSDGGKEGEDDSGLELHSEIIVFEDQLEMK
jgi:hypothetical protein